MNNMKDNNILEYSIKRSKDHLYNNGQSPQSYYAHCSFAVKNSLILIFGGILGIIHGLLPFLFPFHTSSIVIHSFRKLVDSKRHKHELRELLSEGYLLKKHIV